MSSEFSAATLQRTVRLGIIVVLIVGPCVSGHTWDEETGKMEKSESNLAPEFDEFTISEIEATKGQTLLLPCIVRNLGDKVVSWIRRKDLQILTSGPVTFSADSRFESVYSSSRDFWGLRIRGARISDTGQYECQVNTDPKMSHVINLTVTERPRKTYPKYVHKATITGPNEVYAHEGDPVTLTCEITPLIIPFTQTDEHTGSLFPPNARVQWFHEQKDLAYQSENKGISSENDYSNPHKLTSRLRISSATVSDDGIYSCTYVSSLTDSIRLVVIEAEHTEAMLGDFPQDVSGTRCIFPSVILTAIFTLAIMY